MIAPEPDHRSPPYAGLARRLVAAVIDLALAWAAYSLAITAFDPGIASDYPTTLEAALVAAIVLAVAGMWLGYLVLAQSRWGQTLGMRFLGMEVVEGPGGRPTWGRALVRTVSLVVDLIVGPLLIAVSRRRQRLGDRLANTVVVMKRDEASEPAGAGALETEEPGGPPPAAGGGAPPPDAPQEPSPGRVGATWGPGRVGVGILVLLVLSVVEVAIVSIFDPSLDSLAARLAAQALLAATLVGVAFGVGGDTLRGASASAAMGLRKSLRSPWGRAALAYLAYVVFAVAYSSLVHPEQKDITRDLGVGQGELGAIAAGILIIGVAPISEEVFFRGFIYGGFRRRLSFPAAAILSAVIFGLFHYTGSGSLTVVPQLAVLGLAFCWVYEETGSIYPTVALHTLNNAFAFAVLAS